MEIFTSTETIVGLGVSLELYLCIFILCVVDHEHEILFPEYEKSRNLLV